MINHLYLAALSRPPRSSEVNHLLAVMNETREAAGNSQDAQAARRQAIEDLVWAVLTSKEFLFNH